MLLLILLPPIIAWILDVYVFLFLILGSLIWWMFFLVTVLRFNLVKSNCLWYEKVLGTCFFDEPNFKWCACLTRVRPDDHIWSLPVARFAFFFFWKLGYLFSKMECTAGARRGFILSCHVLPRSIETDCVFFRSLAS